MDRFFWVKLKRKGAVGYTISLAREKRKERNKYGKENYKGRKILKIPKCRISRKLEREKGD